MGRADPSLHEMDQLRVPYRRLKSSVDFAARLKGPRDYGQMTYTVSTARQRIDFRLHEKGAEVRAVAETGLPPFGSAPAKPRPFPRDFSYDRPFFVFLWRDEADWPCAGVWTGDTSAMRRRADE